MELWAALGFTGGDAATAMLQVNIARAASRRKYRKRKAKSTIVDEVPDEDEESELPEKRMCEL